MKAIKVTHKLKSDNPDLFGAVDSIYAGRIPKTFMRGREVCLAYDARIDLQALDGWKEVVEPTIGVTQKRGAIIDAGNVFTYEVLELTPEELVINYEVTMPRNTFKLALLRGYGVKNSDVDSLFSVLIAQGLATEIQVEEMKILWYESAVFKNTTPELFQFAATLTAMNPNISITSNELKQIFTDYANS